MHIIIQNRSFTNRYTKQIKKLEKTGAVSSERIARRKLSVNSETILPVNWKFENLIFKMIEHKWQHKTDEVFTNIASNLSIELV